MKQTALRSGDWVRVRPEEEILATLDSNGRLEQMPFMPEMLRHCGATFQVGKRAHKTCDPVNGLESRKLPRTVHLEGLRCDGTAHGGCQAGCLLYWKEDWLEPVSGPNPSTAAPRDRASGTSSGSRAEGCSLNQLEQSTIQFGAGTEDVIYSCQATQVAAATTPLRWWDMRQYAEDLRSRNATVGQMLSVFVFWCYHSLSNLGLGLGSAMHWAYDKFQQAIGGSPYPWRHGQIPLGSPTPMLKHDIKEGDVVRVKPYHEILSTLNDEWKNRGMYFDAEMVPYTDQTHRVLKRVNRIIDEKTGKMLTFKNECLILDEVVCQARYAKCRKLCPRAYYLYWRDVWVEPVVSRDATSAGRAS